MLHSKLKDNQASGSGEDFQGFLPYMGMAQGWIQDFWKGG